jgi:hypothetical protein
MGQKYAAYNAQGAITGYYDSIDSPVPTGVDAIEITDAEWLAAVSTQGGAVYTVVGGVLTAPTPPTQAELLAAAQAVQSSTLSNACASAIVSGFTSDALGAAHTYPSGLTDQQNQGTVSACASGGLLWCETNGTWSFVQHTQVQAQSVVASFAEYLNQCQSQLVSLIAQVNAAESTAAVEAVAWVAP